VSLKGGGGSGLRPPGRRKKPDPGKVYRWDVDVKKNPMVGAADALVTIVEVSEFQCPFCRRAAKTVKELVGEYPKDLRLFFFHSPIPNHKKAFLAAEAAQAVFHLKGTEAFWKFHDILFENRSALDQSDLESYGKQVAVEAKKFKEALDKRTYQRTLRRHQARYRRVGGSGVPGFFINGRWLSGAQPKAKFKSLIDEELAKARKLVKEKKIARSKVYEHIMKTALKKVQ